MKILAIDTTSERGSIALNDGERVLEEAALLSTANFSQILFGEIENLLARHRLRIGDVQAFASASGPGTFTGVRLGLAAAKGLAEASSRKIVAVSNLQAMAAFGTRGLRGPWIDARRGEIYGAVYNSTLELVRDEVVMNRELWIASLPDDVEILCETRLLAGAIGTIAAGELAGGRGLDPVLVDANYVRRSDAAMHWTDEK